MFEDLAIVSGSWPKCLDQTTNTLIKHPGTHTEVCGYSEPGRISGQRLENVKVLLMILMEQKLVQGLNRRLLDWSFHLQLLLTSLSQQTKSKVGVIKIVNGKRAILKRRVKASPAPAQFLPPTNIQTKKENNLKTRDEQLKTLREQRQSLLLLQQRQSGARQESPRCPPSSSPARDPYLSGVDLSSGSFSYSYGR